ncbi:acetyltransferase [Tamlana flava]|uniref:acetyltransferase n=1 Tax=Tamlana flava TaxID=3158572 RepID=UPI00351AC4A3
MIIVGAKGFAKELLQIVSVDMEMPDDAIVFFDNMSTDLPDKIFNRFKLLKSLEAVKDFMVSSGDASFVLGLGNPRLREKLHDEFILLGAVPKTVISKNAEIGSFDVKLGEGTSVMTGARISNAVTIGKGCLIYYNAIITHDCQMGNFVEMSPGATILGRCTIGNYTMVGAGAIILPDVTIGNNVTIGAGAVILNDVPDNYTVVGVPGRIISKQ